MERAENSGCLSPFVLYTQVHEAQRGQRLNPVGRRASFIRERVSHWYLLAATQYWTHSNAVQ